MDIQNHQGHVEDETKGRGHPRGQNAAVLRGGTDAWGPFGARFADPMWRCRQENLGLITFNGIYIYIIYLYTYLFMYINYIYMYMYVSIFIYIIFFRKIVIHIFRSIWTDDDIDIMDMFSIQYFYIVNLHAKIDFIWTWRCNKTWLTTWNFDLWTVIEEKIVGCDAPLM